MNEIMNIECEKKVSTLHKQKASESLEEFNKSYVELGLINQTLQGQLSAIYQILDEFNVENDSASVDRP